MIDTIILLARNLTTSRRKALYFTTVLAACGAFSGNTQAAEADFSLGEGSTSASHQFEGTSGEGWLGPWGTATEDLTLTANVTNSDPMFATDNYLSLGLAPIAPDSNNRYRSAVNRGAESSIVSSEHQVVFSIRPDDLTGFTDSLDVFGIFATPTAITSTTSTSAQTWGIYISGSSGEISFRNGESTPGGTSVDSGISFTEGVTYTFTLTIDPENTAWVGNITTSTAESFTSDTMDFRSQTNLGNYVNINTLMDDGTEAWTYSLSGLSVTAIPESSSSSLGILVGAGALALLFSKRWRSRTK